MLNKVLFSGLWLVYFTIPVLCLSALIENDILPKPAGSLSVVTLLPIYLALFFPFRVVSNFLDKKLPPEQ